ncbi:MAG TPA: FAD-dependent oxidoreductase, partial [Rhodanobacteraceae bacterium]|nr:FAD-dependent oxidoreductase [Rhodanobacteraceae bacterium]
MEHSFDYLILGAGMAGSAAAKGIRSRDAKGTIALLGAEPHPPYDRPPLSKDLWSGKKTPGQIWRDIEGLHATLFPGRHATAIEPRSRTVRDDHGDHFHFGKLLIATGGTPRRIAGLEGDRVIYYRTLDDYHALRDALHDGIRVAVIGAGFIGSELAAALTMNGACVTLLVDGDFIGERVYPRALAESVTNYFREKDVEIRTHSLVSGGSITDEGVTLRLENGDSVEAEWVVAGLGITPNVQLAQAAGLRVDNGITVDEQLRAAPDVWVAGDAANYPDATLGQRRRVEHEDAALTMGEHAGTNMAGANAPYRHLPYFYSDLFDLGYEAVGELDTRLQTFEDWKEPFREGVVYYLKDGRVRGALLWNVWDRKDAARELIAHAGPLNEKDLRGRL